MGNQAGSFALLPSTVITTALSSVAQTPAPGAGYTALEGPSSASFLAIFTYGSSGTTCKAYVQTSLDGGATWFDIACFAFTTSTLTKLSAITTAIAPATQAATPTSGTLADNTINQGVLGDRFRVVLLTTGTYAGSTTLAVHMFARR